jgi:hypothetical protein
MRKSLQKTRQTKKEVDLDELQEFRVQELKEALTLEPDPEQIIIHQYAKKVVQKSTITKHKKLTGESLNGKVQVNDSN